MNKLLNLIALTLLCAATASAQDARPRPAAQRGSFAVDDTHVRFFSPLLKESAQVMLITDTHLHLDDERGAPFRKFSARMAASYHKTKHFKTGAFTNPQESFEKSLTEAKAAKVDLIAMLGDIFSFPSEAGMDWVSGKLAGAGLPYLYISGNHDWHYEGMPGSLDELRATWTEKRLKPLYQGKDPLMATCDVKGVRFVALDDSTSEINQEQLAFFRAQVASGRPLVLLMHVPLYAPGRSVGGFAVGHPDWNSKNDKNFAAEGRPQWPESGHTTVTRQFHHEVFAAPNLLGIFVGHIHQASLDVVNGIPQFVVPANANGGSMIAEFIPQSKADVPIK